jgi:hypothetical protein
MSDETNELLQKYIGIHGTAIMACISVMLDQQGYDVQPIKVESKNIWDAGLTIKKKDSKKKDGDDVNKVDYFFHNTFIEVFCVDRDDDPLVFDEKHDGDFEYTVNKIGSVLEGRYILIVGVLEGKTIEEIYEENSDKYERVRKKMVKAEDIDGVTF